MKTHITNMTGIKREPTCQTAFKCFLFYIKKIIQHDFFSEHFLTQFSLLKKDDKIHLGGPFSESRVGMGIYQLIICGQTQASVVSNFTFQLFPLIQDMAPIGIQHFLNNDLEPARMTLGQVHETPGYKQSLCELSTSNVCT